MVNQNKIFTFKIKSQAKNVFLNDAGRTVGLKKYIWSPLFSPFRWLRGWGPSIMIHTQRGMSVSVVPTLTLVLVASISIFSLTSPPSALWMKLSCLCLMVLLRYCFYFIHLGNDSNENGRVISAPDWILTSQVWIPLAAEFSSWLYGASLHRAFHYHPSFMCIMRTRLFKYVENFTSRKWKFSDKKTLIIFIFVLKT